MWRREYCGRYNNQILTMKKETIREYTVLYELGENMEIP
jgi:hypothetical protein